MLLRKVTKVTTEHQKWPKMSLHIIILISFFLPVEQTKASEDDRGLAEACHRG